MVYKELKQLFRDLKKASPKKDLTAHIVFTEDSFAIPYSLLSRTYCVSSDNKAFWPHMSDRSIFAYRLDNPPTRLSGLIGTWPRKETLTAGKSRTAMSWSICEM